MPKATAKTKKVAPPKRVFTSEEEEAKGELDNASALEAVAVSKGGVLIIQSLTTDVVTLVEMLAVKYKKATQLELVSMCADLKTKIDVLRSLTRAGKNKQFLIEQLGDALKE